MPTIINGKDVNESLLEKLNKTIEANNEITSKQNALMVKHTKWLCGLTIAIGIIALIQLIVLLN